MMRALARVSTLQWRREMLLGALMLMESSVAAALFIPLTTTSSRHGAPQIILAFAGMMLLVLLATRLIPESGLGVRWQQTLVAFLILASLLALTRFHVYARFPLGDGGWMRQMLADWGGVFSGLTDAPLAAIAVLFAWWRGMRLNYRELTLPAVSFSFRINVLWLVVAGILWDPSRTAEIGILVYLYFFSALLAMALARVDEISQQKGGEEQPFGAGWLSIVLASGGVVVGLGWALAQWYSPAGFRQLGQWLSPVSRALGTILYDGLLLLARLLEPVFTFLFHLFQMLMTAAWERLGGSDQPMPQLPPVTPMPGPGVEGGFPWAEVFKWSAIVVLLLVVILGLSFSLRKLIRQNGQGGTGTRRTILPAGEWRDDLMANLRAGMDHLVDSLQFLGRFGMGMELYAAISIRHIYANVGRLAARRGYPRHQATTPYEYLSSLKQAFSSDLEGDLSRITDAYVGVRYGEAPSTMEELNAIRRAWERVRDGAEPEAL